MGQMRGQGGRVAVGRCGIPTKVVTLWAASVTVTRDCETLTADPCPKFLLADVS